MSHHTANPLIGELQPIDASPHRVLAPMMAAVVGASATLYVGGHSVTKWQQRHQPLEGETIINHNDSERNVITLVGHRAEAQTLANLVEPFFGQRANTAYIGYSKRALTLEDVGKAVLRARHSMGSELPVSFYCHSFGGPVWSRLFQDPEYRTAFGKVDRVVFDSSPSGVDDVAPGPRLALELATHTKHSLMMNTLAKGILRLQANRLSDDDDDVPNRQAMLAHRLATAKMPLYAIAEQGRHLKECQVNELHEVAERAYYVQAPSDHVVNTDQAFTRYHQAFNGNISRIIDNNRPVRNHAGGAEHPELVTNLLTN